MSLFKARDWWCTTVGEEEEFDTGCLCVANIDNGADGDKIVVGSFHGFLRIYKPCPVKTESGWSGFRPEDVLCEVQLPNPILQLEAGRFIGGSDSLHLAVLQPRKISIYSVVRRRGEVEHGTQYLFKPAYEHNLKRSAFNFCYGPFGGVKNRDFLCVQSMDGTVSVFEQESFAFCRFLPGALLPGPLRYVQRTDSFVTVSSARQVESYKYKVLAVANDAKTKEESENIKCGKKVSHDWVLNIGEQALDINVAVFGNAPPSILILGERSFYIISDTGKLRFMKKLDFNASCFLPYTTVREGSINTIIGTHTNTLVVHEDVTVRWAAQLPYVPVQVCVGHFSGLQGVIVTIDEEGHLQCSYLGTDPGMFTRPAVDVHEMDYVEQDREMKQLQTVIREHQAMGNIVTYHDPPTPVSPREDDVQVTVYVNPDLDQVSQAVDVELEDEDPIPSITARLRLKANILVTDVRLTIHAPPPLACTEHLIAYPSLDPGRPAEIQVSFFLQRPLLPSETKVDIITTYTAPGGAPHVMEVVITLPLKLFVKPCVPSKNAAYKVTLDTNKAPVNLNDIFPDLLGQNAGGPGSALGFEIYGGPVISVLAAKSSSRYRLQCDVFEALWLLLHETYQRLIDYHLTHQVDGFKVTYEGALPLQEYFELVDRHFECRLRDAENRKMLADRAKQFRAIQCRLLVRFKDTSPIGCGHMDSLLEATYHQIMELADWTQENLQLEQRHAASVRSATYMLNLLLRLSCDMSDAELSILQAALTPIVTESGDERQEGLFQGWEEIVEASITHLLRTCLTKNSKDTTMSPSPPSILKDTTKLKKHIALLCERLMKGGKLSDGQVPAEVPSSIPDPLRKVRREKVAAIAPGLFHEDEEDQVSLTLGEAEIPLGSKYGEMKTPRGVREQSPCGGKDSSSDSGSHGEEPPALNSTRYIVEKQMELVPNLDNLPQTDNPNSQSLASKSYIVEKPMELVEPYLDNSPPTADPDCQSLGSKSYIVEKPLELVVPNLDDFPPTDNPNSQSLGSKSCIVEKPLQLVVPNLDDIGLPPTDDSDARALTANSECCEG